MVMLLVVAVALGLSNLAASVGIGVSGTDWRVRVRVAVVFGLFETAMPVIGLLLGHGLATSLGGATRWTGGGLLAVAGAYELIGWVRERRAPAEPTRAGGGWGGWRLLVSGAALSLDNLAVGFALGTLKVPVAIAVIVFGVVSVAMSLAGLELGAKIGAVAGAHGELLAGLVLIAVGAFMAAAWL